MIFIGTSCVWALSIQVYWETRFGSIHFFNFVALELDSWPQKHHPIFLLQFTSVSSLATSLRWLRSSFLSATFDFDISFFFFGNCSDFFFRKMSIFPLSEIERLPLASIWYSIRWWWWWERAYLIFVHSINSGASVKKLTEGNFFLTINAKRTSDKLPLYTVLVHIQCVILHTVWNLTHSV